MVNSTGQKIFSFHENDVVLYAIFVPVGKKYM